MSREGIWSTVLIAIAAYPQQPTQELAQAEQLAKAGQHEPALERYRAAETVCNVSGDRNCQAGALYGIGRTYTSLSKHTSALDAYRAAAEIRRSIGGKGELAAALHYLGASHWFLGDNPQALEAYREALSLRSASEDPAGRALTLYGMGAAYWSMGEAQPALDSYRDALNLFRKLKNAFREADALNSLGLVYAALGDTEEALEQYQAALVKWRALGNRARERYTLSNLGLAYAPHEPQKAIEVYERALPLVQGDDRAIAYVTQNLGEALARLGRHQAALGKYEESRKRKRALGDRFGEAHSLHAMGESQLAISQPRTARGALEEALRLRREMADHAGEAATLAALASVDHREGNLAAARGRMEECLRLVESARYEIAAASLRSSYLASRHRYYEQMVELLADTDPKAAFETSERARARELLDALVETTMQVRAKVDPDLLRRQRDIERRLSRLDQSSRKQAEDLLREWEEAEGRIRARNPNFAELTHPHIASASEIQRELVDSQTVLLEYFLAERRSFLFVVSSGRVERYILPPRAAVERLARRVYDSLRSRASTIPPHPNAAELSRLLLGPVSAAIRGKRLLIVADGLLQYLPFAALPVPAESSRYLVERHELVYLPSASTVVTRRARGRTRLPARGVAIVADPTTGKDFPRLRFSRLEAERILALASGSRRFSALGTEATRDALTTGKLNDYSIIHLATHAIIDTMQPDWSRIIFAGSPGGAESESLRLWEIYNLQLRADLVVLSACQTALGRQVRGEGLIGLTRGFLHAGVRRVAASLWDVQDRATAELMARFYRGLLRGGLTPAAALRQAQLGMLRDARWNPPYYWAAFVIQGDWGR